MCMSCNIWLITLNKFCVHQHYTHTQTHEVFMVMNIHAVATLSTRWGYHANILQKLSASIKLLLTCQTTQWRLKTSVIWYCINCSYSPHGIIFTQICINTKPQTPQGVTIQHTTSKSCPETVFSTFNCNRKKQHHCVQSSAKEKLNYKPQPN
jgi:hypothetical protein